MKQQKRKGGRGRGRHLPLLTVTPSSKRILMTYSAVSAQVEAAAGIGITYFYRLNSVYDPDASGVGTSALGYSTWSGLFLNYKVRRVTARVQATVRGMTAGSIATVTVAPIANQAVVPSNKLTWASVRGAQVRYVANATEGGRNLAQFVMTIDNAWVAQVTKQQYDVDMDFSGAVGSNPSRMNYLCVAAASAGSTTAATVVFNIQLTYEVEWFNPIPMQ